MKTRKINLPEISITDITDLSPGPNGLKPWLDALPLGDMELSAQQVVAALQQYNRCSLSVDVRLQAMDTFSRTVQELVKGLASKYRESTFPLSDRNRNRSQLVAQLLEEMAFGFKYIVNDSHQQFDREQRARGGRQSQQPGVGFFNAIRIAIVYLSRQLITAYSTYALEPQGVWLDLHQLYKLAGSYQTQDFSSEYNEKCQANIQIIQHAYVRIVLLSITNPYHLMQGEAQLIYNYLNKWCTGCRIVPIAGYIVARGDLVIDFDQDAPPHFIFNQDLDDPEDYRTVDLKRMMTRFNETVDGLTTRKAAGGVENVKLTFTERLRRDMLFRLQSVWAKRLQRQSQRKLQEQPLRVASGLSASHYFLDDERDFLPESDEVNLHRPESLVDALELVPAELEPWKHETQQAQVESSLEQQRISKFDDRMDVWGKIYASKSYASHIRDTNAVQYHSYTWQQINASENGLGLRRDPDSNSYISMGSIVAYRDEQQGARWRLGIIRWIKEYAGNHLDVGLALMQGVPNAVAVRAISGAGDGSEYFRAILLVADNNGSVSTTLIAPAAMYDVGTQLVVNYREALQYIKLTRLLKTSTCCSLFQFADINIPDEEQEKIRKLKTA